MDCLTLSSVVESASHILGDQEAGNEYEAFQKPVLLGYACQVLALLAEIHPEKFTVKKRIELKPGSAQDFSGECDNFRGLVGVEDADGRLLPASEANDIELLQRLVGFPDPCAGGCDSAGKPQFQFASSPDNPSLVVFAPPIGIDDKYTAVINCRDEQSMVLDPDKPIPPRAASLVPAIREWVLYSATATDDEVIEGCSANVHYRAFLNLVPAAAEKLALRAKGVGGKQ